MDSISQKLWLYYIFLSEAALQIHQMLSVEEILKYSKDVMTTMGEWELVGITGKKYQLPAGDGEMYEEIRFFVRKYCNPLKSHVVLFYLFTQP